MAYAYGGLGLTPLQFAKMTESDYVLLCAGKRDKDLSDLRVSRFIAWSAFIAPRVDGQSSPKTVEAFWPIGEDKPVLEPIPQEVLIQWDKQFRGLA